MTLYKANMMLQVQDLVIHHLKIAYNIYPPRTMCHVYVDKQVVSRILAEIHNVLTAMYFFVVTNQHGWLYRHDLDDLSLLVQATANQELLEYFNHLLEILLDLACDTTCNLCANALMVIHACLLGGCRSAMVQTLIRLDFINRMTLLLKDVFPSVDTLMDFMNAYKMNLLHIVQIFCEDRTTKYLLLSDGCVEQIKTINASMKAGDQEDLSSIPVLASSGNSFLLELVTNIHISEEVITEKLWELLSKILQTFSLYRCERMFVMTHMKEKIKEIIIGPTTSKGIHVHVFSLIMHLIRANPYALREFCDYIALDTDDALQFMKVVESRFYCAHPFTAYLLLSNVSGNNTLRDIAKMRSIVYIQALLHLILSTRPSLEAKNLYLLTLLAIFVAINQDEKLPECMLVLVEYYRTKGSASEQGTLLSLVPHFMAWEESTMIHLRHYITSFTNDRVMYCYWTYTLTLIIRAIQRHYPKVQVV